MSSGGAGTVVAWVLVGGKVDVEEMASVHGILAAGA